MVSAGMAAGRAWEIRCTHAKPEARTAGVISNFARSGYCWAVLVRMQGYLYASGDGLWPGRFEQTADSIQAA